MEVNLTYRNLVMRDGVGRERERPQTVSALYPESPLDNLIEEVRAIGNFFFL